MYRFLCSFCRLFFDVDRAVDLLVCRRFYFSKKDLTGSLLICKYLQLKLVSGRMLFSYMSLSKGALVCTGVVHRG